MTTEIKVAGAIKKPEEVGTLYGAFVERVRRTPDNVAYVQYERESKTWTEKTWAEMAEMIAFYQSAYRRENLQVGDRVAIIMKNCREWVAADIAALGLGLVTVPLYCDDRADNVAYILNDSVTKILVVEGAMQWQRIASSVMEVESLQRIVLMEPDKAGNLPRPEDSRMVLIDDWLPEEAEPAEAVRFEDYEKLASIVYTSGTTGRPKGVMLSHKNMMSVAAAALDILDVDERDMALSFLPLSHTFERTCGYYITILTGTSTTYSRGILQLADDLQVVRPTALIGVPRIFERIYARLKLQLDKDSAFKRFVFNSAVSVGWSRFLWKQGRSRWKLSFIFWPLLHKLVAGKVMDRLGGRMRFAVAGGAALPEAVAKTFIGLGLPVIQGYGMTETSPVVAVNAVDDNIPSTVGKILPGMEARIAEDGELQVKTPGRMMGYWNNHAATEDVLMEDGWIHTGDIAEFEGQHLRITGRIKDIVVMSNGEKLPPGDMENAIMLDTLFEQVMIVGEGKQFLSALVILNPDVWYDFANSKGWDPKDENTLKDPKVIRAINMRVQATLKEFPAYAKIRRVYPSIEPWSVENGLLTPTLKVKRAKVLERFSSEIDAMYEGMDHV